MRAGTAGSLSPVSRSFASRRGSATPRSRRSAGRAAEVTEPLKRAALLPAQVEIALAAGEVEEARTACLELRELAEQYESAMLDAIVAHAAGRRRARRGRRAVGARESAPRAAHLARARRSVRGRPDPRADRTRMLGARRRRGVRARARRRPRAVRASRSRARPGARLDARRREPRAVGARARGPAARRLGEEQPRDRVDARHQRAHRREAPAEHLREARRLLARRRDGLRVRARARLARGAWSEMTTRSPAQVGESRRCRVVRPSYRRLQRRQRRQDDEAGRALRDGDRRRGPGRALRRLPPEAAGALVRDPRCERADRRLVAQPLGLAPALLAGVPRRAAGDAVPGAAHRVPDEGRDGRLPRGVRDALRAPGPQRRGRRGADEGETAATSRTPAAGR